MHFDCKKKTVSFRLINFAKDHVVDYENITKLSIGCLGFFLKSFSIVYTKGWKRMPISVQVKIIKRKIGNSNFKVIWAAIFMLKLFFKKMLFSAKMTKKSWLLNFC